MPVPCRRHDDPDSLIKFTQYERMSTVDNKTPSTTVYQGPYDLKYYLDRQPIEISDK
jgi:hypothetical protein